MTTTRDTPISAPITVRQAHGADAGVSAPLAEAFAEDPVMATFVPSGPGRLVRLDTLFTALLRSGPLAAGTVDVAVDQHGDVVGTAVWEAPRTGPEPVRPFIAQLPRFLRALGLRGALAAARHRAVLQRPRPRLPHWYLAEIGVSARARGLGVGTVLLEHRLGQIDEARGAAYLESSTDRNRALYRRHGFVELGTITGLPSGEPTAMWRPRASAPTPI
jgi:ribosomal protein S18 acetylase RimI-like enzyme